MTPARTRRAALQPLSPLRRSIPVALIVCAMTAATAAAYPLVQHATPALRVKISKRPVAYSRSASATFAWNAMSATRTLCRMDAKKFGTCRKRITYRHVPAGKHTFSVRVYRGKRFKTAKAKWVVDLTPPTPPVVAGGSASWVTTPIVIAASGSADVGTGVASYRYRESMNGGLTWSATATGARTTITKSGTTWVQFQAVDRAGNVSAWAPAVAGAANTACHS